MKRKIFYIAALLLINGLSFSNTEIPDEELYKIIETELMYRNFETTEEAFTEAKKIYLSRNNLPLPEDKESFIPVLNEEIKYEAPKSSKVTYGLFFEGGFRYLTDKYFSKGRVEEWKRENPLGYDKDKTDTDIPDYTDKLVPKDFEFSDLLHTEILLPEIALNEVTNIETLSKEINMNDVDFFEVSSPEVIYSLSSNGRIDTPIVKNKGYFSLKNTGTAFAVNGIDGSKGSKGDAADNKGGDGEDGGNGGNAFEVSGGYLVPGNNFDTVIVTAGKGGDGGNGGGGGGGQEGGQGGGGSGVPISPGDGGDGGDGGRGGNAIGATITSNTNLFGKVIATGGKGGSAGSGGGGGWHPTAGDGDDGRDGTFGSGGNAVGINSANKTFNNYGKVVATGGKNGAGQISGTGIGIQGNNNSIDNSGIILGSTNSIKGNNNNINNLGILGTFSGSNTISGSGNNVKNLGITISYNEDGTVKNVTSSSSGATATVDGKKYTSMTVNSVNGNQSNKVINATNSNRYLTINSNIKFNNVIINGAHNSKGSLNVTGGTTEISNSQINSLFTAAEVANGTLVAMNTVFNGSGDIVDINNNGKVVIANESVVLGNINMTNGNNSLVLSNSYFDGTIKTGSGSNDITLDQMKYEGTLDLSKGNDNITISNGTQLGGFTLGSGHNTVTVDNAEYLKHIDLSQGNDSLWLQNGGSISSVTFGNGNNTFGILNTKYSKDINLKEGNNEGNFNSAILEGKLTAGNGNDKLNMTNGLIKGNVNLGNGSNQAFLTDSGIKGSLTTGTGRDHLKLNDSVVDGTVNLGNGNNTIDILGEGAGITGTLTTGNGNDTLISYGGVIGDNVDLAGGTNSIDLSNGGIIGDLTSFITSKLKMIAAVIQGDVNLGAGDKDINLSANSGILGTLTAGNDNDNLTMETSIIEGNVNLAEGENSLNLDNSVIEGTVITGYDNDTLNLANSVTGGVHLGNGNNQISLVDSGIKGSLNTGSGADNLQVNNSVIIGNTNLGDGNNTISIQGESAGITGTLTTGSGNDTLTSNGGVIGNNVNLGTGINSIDLTNGGIIGDLTSFITSKLKMATAVIQGNVDLGSGDKDIELTSNSGILGNLTTGNDKDNLSMNDSLIKGNVSLAEGKNTLNLHNSVIEGTITTGKGNDMLNLTDSLTGRVDLSSGDNRINLTDSGIKGSLNTGSGADNLQVNNSVIEGSANLGGGNNTINIQGEGAGITGALTAGSGNDILFSNGGVLGSNVNLGTGINSIDLTNGGIIGDLTSLITSKLKMATAVIQGNVSLGTGDKSINLSSNSGILGNLTADNDKDNLTMDTSIIKGNVDLAEGENTLTLDNSIIEGTVTTGNDNDTFNLVNSVAGGVNLGSGDNRINLTDSGIKGSLNTGSGADNLQVNGSIIEGNTNLGDGNNTINVQGEGAGITSTLTTGSGDDTLISNGGVIGNTVNLGGGVNFIDLTNGGIIGDLTSLITSKLKMTTAVIQGNVNLGSGDKDINLSANSGILGNLVAGNGKDNLSMNDSLIKGNVSLAEGENSLNLRNSVIKGTITTGKDNDMLNLTDSLTGRVNLGEGQNKINLSDSGIKGDLTTGSGADNLLMKNSVIDGEVNLGDGGNVISMNDSHIDNLITGTGNDQVSLHFIPRETYTQSNVKIDLGDGNNSLIVGEMIALTGRIQGGKDNDFMSTEGDTKLDLVLNDFEDLTLKGKTFLSPTSKLNSKEISFEKELYLDIDESKKDSIGRYTGHGLYDTGSHLGTLEGEFVVNSTETNFMERVTFGDTDLTDISEGVRSDSIIHQAKLDKNGDVVIVTDNALDIPDIEGIPGAGLEGSHIRYEELNKVYQSIYNAGKVHYLAGDVTLTDKDNWQAFGNLLSFLNQIYGNTIYGHSQKLSIDTLESFTEGIRNNFHAPYEGEWNVQGITLSNSSYRKNRHIGAEYYGFDNGSEAYTIKSQFTGLIGLMNYGVTDNLTTGIAFGGGKQWNDFTKDSRLDGDSFYLGLHSKYADNFYNTPHKYSVAVGIGIQRNLYKGRRTVITNFTDTHNTENFSTTSLNGYLEGKVEYELTDRLTLTPGYISNISSARQGSISETYTESALALETDKSIQTIYSNTLSLELSKYFDYKEWDYNIYGKVGYTRKSGDVSHSINSRIKGSSSDFIILGSETGRDEGGFEMGVRGSKDNFNYSISSYATRGSHHEREYGVKVSLSYMFNKVEDFIPTRIETSLSVKPKKVTEVLSGFELESSELTSEMEKDLERITSEVTEGVIKITGHTDNTGTDKINEKLSMERAEAAKKKMSETIDNTRIETTGKGSKEPISSNATPEGQARNRRVEIEIR